MQTLLFRFRMSSDKNKNIYYMNHSSICHLIEQFGFHPISKEYCPLTLFANDSNHWFFVVSHSELVFNANIGKLLKCRYIDFDIKFEDALAMEKYFTEKHGCIFYPFDMNIFNMLNL